MLSELLQSRVHYILNNMEDAVCLTEMNGELVYANPAAERLFGLDMNGRAKIWDAIPYVEGNDALIQLFIDGVMEKKKPLRAVVDYVNNEGARFHLHVTLTCESEESEMILIVIHDLTSLIKVHSAFERYTSPEIADFVLTTPDGEKQGGKSLEVSILMSDLRGFTAISQRLPSGDLINMVNHYFGEMAAVIQRHRGTIIEFLGDGIFVVFGAPQEFSDHAEAAVSCAIEMQNAMAGVNAWNLEHGYPELDMGIGIHSGPVIAGNIGSNQKMKYGCIGETCNLAGRLESFCLGGEVCVTKATRDRINGKLKILMESSFLPKGSRKKLVFYSVGGIEGKSALSGDEKIRWRKLPKAKEVVFYLLKGKAVQPEPHAGRLTEVSEDGKYGLLVTGAILPSMENLMLRIGGVEAYAKVRHSGRRGCRIGFTMKPEGFDKEIGRD